MAKFKCTNKDCERFGEEIDFMQYRSKIVDGESVYMDKQFNQIVCKNKSVFSETIDGQKVLISKGCGEILEFIQPEVDGFPQVRTQTFNSMTPTQKKQVLMKRMNEHDKKGNEFTQFKEAVDRGEVGQYGK